MAITIDLPEETERILAIRASEYGQTLETFVAKVLIREARKKSLEEVLAPFRKEFEESGMTEEELGDLIQEARREIWQEKHGNPSKVDSK